MSSAFGRLLKLGGVAARVGASLATGQAMSFLSADPVQQARKTENYVRNALRVTEALGELKGAAMKVGQMLSVHEGLLPLEVSEVLRTLQKEAPRVSFARMVTVLRSELPDFDARFERIEPNAIAAASIGQVYRGRLRDGRMVAVKVQYPDIDEVIRSDLKNLKKLLGALVAMLVDVDFDEIWEELAARLLEELDYEHEAANMAKMRSLHAALPSVVIPDVIAELSTRRVLTMEYVPALSPDAACSDAYPAALKDAWGRELMLFVVRGVLRHRFLHADPNFANFGFREDGALVVYDFGCMKEIPEPVAHSCANILKALMEGRAHDLPALLFDLGVYKQSTGQPVPLEILEPVVREAMAIVGPEPYRFSRETDLYELIFDLKSRYFAELRDVVLPPDMVFINRTLSGTYGNLCRLGCEGRWRELLAPLL